MRYRQRADGEHREDADDEEVRGRGEQAARLAHPRRLPSIRMRDERQRHLDRGSRGSAGSAEVIAATPAAMLTATVST